MKKLIALLCAFIMLATCCITANAATLNSMVPDEEIAKEHGYTIEYYLKDGWLAPSHYLANNDYIPNSIVIIANKELDISQYVTGEVEDFYGVDILKITSFVDGLSDEMRELYFKQTPNRYPYTITTTEFFTPEEAETLFADCDFVTEVGLNQIARPNEDIEEVAGDINFDNVFDSMDYLMLKRAYFNQYPEANLYCNKADLNNNLEIDSTDYLMLRRLYFGQYEIQE